jgi:hypothetical protein
MARRDEPNFLGPEVLVAGFVALAAQAVFVALFTAGEATPIKADISDENSKPISVAITPVVNDLPLLKLGGKPKPGQLPDMWKKKPPPKAVKTSQNEAENAITPSTKASDDVSSIPDGAVTEAAVAPTDAEVVGAADPNLADAPPSDVDPNLNGPGSAAGSELGTETDPLKAQAVDQYRAELVAWFQARFNIRGKIPFDVLKSLSAHVVAQIGGDRKVSGWSLTNGSGNDVFDATVKSTMDGIVASGAVLPPPPPAYPDILKSSLPVGFKCTIQKFCE